MQPMRWSHSGACLHAARILAGEGIREPTDPQRYLHSERGQTGHVTTATSAPGDVVIIDRDGTIVTTIEDASDYLSWQRLPGQSTRPTHAGCSDGVAAVGRDTALIRGGTAASAVVAQEGEHRPDIVVRLHRGRLALRPAQVLRGV